MILPLFFSGLIVLFALTIYHPVIPLCFCCLLRLREIKITFPFMVLWLIYFCRGCVLRKQSHAVRLTAAFRKNTSRHIPSRHFHFRHEIFCLRCCHFRHSPLWQKIICRLCFLYLWLLHKSVCHFCPAAKTAVLFFLQCPLCNLLMEVRVIQTVQIRIFAYPVIKRNDNAPAL